MAYDAWDQDEFDPYEGESPDESENADEVPCPHCSRLIYEDSVQCPFCHLYVEGGLTATRQLSSWHLLYRLAAVTLIVIFLGPVALMLWMLLRHGLP